MRTLKLVVAATIVPLCSVLFACKKEVNTPSERNHPATNSASPPTNTAEAGGVEGSDDGEDMALSSDLDESASLTSNESGYISVRLDATSLVKNFALDKIRIIAVLTGSSFSQRKQGNFSNFDAKDGAFLDWPYLPSTKNYTLYACVDTNGDGLCNEQTFAKAIKPGANIPDQKIRIQWSSMSKSKLGNKILNTGGAKGEKLSFRLTVSPSYRRSGAPAPFNGPRANPPVFKVRLLEAGTEKTVAEGQLTAIPGVSKSLVLDALSSYRAFIG